MYKYIILFVYYIYNISIKFIIIYIFVHYLYILKIHQVVFCTVFYKHIYISEYKNVGGKVYTSDFREIFTSRKKKEVE